MKRESLLILMVAIVPWLCVGFGGGMGSNGVTLGDWTISESGGNLVFAKGGVVHVTMADSEIRCDVYADDDGNDMVVDNGGDLQLKAPGGTDTDYISMFCEAGGERFRFYQAGAIAGGDIDPTMLFFDDDESEEMRWDDGQDRWEFDDTLWAQIVQALSLLDAPSAEVNNIKNQAGTGAPAFPYGITLQEMSAPSTPASGYVYVWSNSGSDDDLTATYDNGKNNIFSTKPN